MFTIDDTVASSDENGNYIGVYSCREYAILESPIKKAIDGFCIVGDTEEEDVFAVEHSRDFYYTRNKAEEDLRKLQKTFEED